MGVPKDLLCKHKKIVEINNENIMFIEFTFLNVQLKNAKVLTKNYI